VCATAGRKDGSNGAQTQPRDDPKVTHEAETFSLERYSTSSRLSRDFRRITYSRIRTTSTPSMT
jgi:hypothetical protein